MLTVALLLGGASRLKAEDLKPVVLVSIPSYNDITADLTFIGQVADVPDLPKQLDALLGQATNGQGLKGLDKTKPIGVAMVFDAGVQKAIVFVGTTDLKALLGSLPIQANSNADGSFDVMAPTGPVHVQQQGGWAVFSNAPDLLKLVPADPSQLLGNLDKDYGAAVRINVQNVPAQSRDMLTGLMKMGFQAAMVQQPGEDDNAYQLRKSSAEQGMKQLDQLIHDMDQITLGLSVDTSAKSVHADVSLTFVPGSEMAKAMASRSSGKSDFAGFLLPNAAVNMNFSQKMSQTDIDQFMQMLKTYRGQAQAAVEKEPSLSDETTQKAAKQLVDQLFDIGEAATKSGKIDGGIALVLDPKALTAAGGFFVPDGSAVEAAFKKFVTLGQSDPSFPAVKFNVETYKDVHFDKMSIPMTDDQAKQVFGDTMDVYLGIGEHSAYIALGKGSIDLLKSVMDKSAAGSPEPLPPFQMNVALTPIVEFINTMQPGNPITSALSQVLSGSEGKDQVKVRAKMIENGAAYRIEVQEGVLKIIGLAAKMGGPHG